MKMNFAVFKKGKPIYWVIGGIVVFALFYLMFNKGAGSSSGITTVNAGPSDAAVAASTQLALAQTNANAGVAVATLQYNGQLAQTQAAADVAKYTANLDAATSAATLDTQKAIAAINAEYSLDTAKVAAETNIAQWTLNANVLTTQLQTNAQMFSDSMKASVVNNLVAAAAQSPHSDIALATIGGELTGSGFSTPTLGGRYVPATGISMIG